MRTFFNGFKAGFQDFGHNISGLVNSILLSAVYVFGVGLTSVAARLFGKRFLVTEPSDDETYWQDLNLETKKMEDHYRQF